MTINICKICPITQEPIQDPVFAPDFYTYERSALEQWLRTNPTSPITRQPMRLEDLKKKEDPEDPIPWEDATTPLLGSPITIITTTVNTVTGQVQTHRQAQQQKMLLFVCPVVIGVIILIFLIRTIS